MSASTSSDAYVVDRFTGQESTDDAEEVATDRSVLGERVDIAQASLQRRREVQRASSTRGVGDVDDMRDHACDMCTGRAQTGSIEGREFDAGMGPRPCHIG